MASRKVIMATTTSSSTNVRARLSLLCATISFALTEVILFAHSDFEIRLQISLPDNSLSLALALFTNQSSSSDDSCWLSRHRL